MLRETVDGFKAAVVKGGFAEGKDVTFDYASTDTPDFVPTATAA